MTTPVNPNLPPARFLFIAEKSRTVRVELPDKRAAHGAYLHLSDGSYIFGFETRVNRSQLPVRFAGETYFIDPAFLKENAVAAFSGRNLPPAPAHRMPDAPGGIGS